MKANKKAFLATLLIFLGVPLLLVLAAATEFGKVLIALLLLWFAFSLTYAILISFFEEKDGAQLKK
jgi:hypothetical protein